MTYARRSLPPDKQQEVIDFVEFLEFKKIATTGHEAKPETKLPLGDRLRKIREEIVASGMPLWIGKE